MNPQLQTMIKNMPVKTGKSLAEWQALLSQAGHEKHGDIMKLLKGEYGVTHGFANTISTLFREQSAGGPPPEADLVAAQYAKKPHFLPVYEKLIQQVKAMGNDVTVAPKKTYVSLVRGKQFAIIKASTMKRMDIGLNLKGEVETDRLQPDTVFSGMCSHRVALSNEGEIDEELINWIRQAYERA
ncbi:DUF5655 domain-containing protein [Marinicella rhabdoformis]|uniref:DUF5655 domain-containing protein n=1 Tax=Marinicella rhabdoformis TaxID=2580566 RepID=UPI0012AEB524|nr:DUF5655 domain-containing protein [Marinicella rhabdoformis]